MLRISKTIDFFRKVWYNINKLAILGKSNSHPSYVCKWKYLKRRYLYGYQHARV